MYESSDDNQLYCGAVHQAEVVGGNCGVCGDPIAQASPRDNEIGGKWYELNNAVSNFEYAYLDHPTLTKQCII